MKAPLQTPEALIAATFLLDGERGVHRVDIKYVLEIRDIVYGQVPDLFDDAELAMVGTAGYLSVPKRPGTFIQFDKATPIDRSDFAVIPGMKTVVGSVPAQNSTAAFWREELLSRTNLIAWDSIVVVLAAVVRVGGVPGLSSALAPLAIFFAVALPVLPLFFKPATGSDLLPFFLSGRLGRWHTAENQLFRVAMFGFVMCLGLQIAVPLGSAAEVTGLGAAAFWIAMVLVSSAAIWLMLGFVSYALPLGHAIEMAEATRQYLRSKATGEPY